jgi:hypothetical protein
MGLRGKAAEDVAAAEQDTAYQAEYETSLGSSHPSLPGLIEPEAERLSSKPQ